MLKYRDAVVELRSVLHGVLCSGVVLLCVFQYGLILVVMILLEITGIVLIAVFHNQVGLLVHFNVKLCKTLSNK